MAVNHAQTRSRPDFGASLPDLRWIDRERAGLFTLIGQIRGVFSSVRRWPWMDDVFQRLSATIHHRLERIRARSCRSRRNDRDVHRKIRVQDIPGPKGHGRCPAKVLDLAAQGSALPGPDGDHLRGAVPGSPRRPVLGSYAARIRVASGQRFSCCWRSARQRLGKMPIRWCAGSGSHCQLFARRRETGKRRSRQALLPSVCWYRFSASAFGHDAFTLVRWTSPAILGSGAAIGDSAFVGRS